MILWAWAMDRAKVEPAELFSRFLPVCPGETPPRAQVPPLSGPFGTDSIFFSRLVPPRKVPPQHRQMCMK